MTGKASPQVPDLVREIALSVDAEISGAVTRRALARSFLDFVLCASAGADEPELVLRRGPSTVLGGGRADPVVAASSNAMAAHRRDRDDLHWPSFTHPGAIVWAAVLALGEAQEVDWRTGARAAAAGYELTTRLGVALGAGHRSAWHVTTTAGTVGAALGAAMVTGDDDPRLAANAVNHAASVAGGSLQALRERSGTSIFHRGHAASTAVAATRAATNGLAAAEYALDGPSGLFATTASREDSRKLATGGPTLAVENLTVRLYACCGFAHAAVDAAASLAVPGRTPAEIVIEVPEVAATLAGGTQTRNPVDAWWSIPHAVATCFAAGTPVGLLEHARPAGAVVKDLLERTRLDSRPTVTHDDLTSRVRVVWSDGATDEAVTPAPKGHPDNPLSDRDLIQKGEWLGLGVRANVLARQLDWLATDGNPSLGDAARNLLAAVSPVGGGE